MKLAGRLTLCAVVAYFGGLLIWVGSDRRAERQALDVSGSTYHRGPDGASLAFGLLSERAQTFGGRVERLAGAIVADELPANGVVFRLLPSEAPSDPPEASPAPDPDESTQQDDSSAGDKKTDAKESKERRADKKDADEKKSDSKTSDEEESDENESDETAQLQLLSEEEEGWVRRGGRFVLAVGSGYGPLKVERQEPGRITKVFPIWRGVEKIRPAVPRALTGGGGASRLIATAPAVFLLGDRPILVRELIGRGELIVLAAPEILSNARLGLGDHLPLLLALAGEADERRPIFWDERVHGFGLARGPLAILGAWGLAPALLLGLLAALVAAWRAAAALGPPERDDPDLRSDAVDLVDALGELYRRALGNRAALGLYRTSLEHSLAVDQGIGVEAAQSAFARALDGEHPAPNFVVLSSPKTAAEDLGAAALAHELARLHRALETFDARKSNRLSRPA